MGKQEVGEKVFGRAGSEWDGYWIDAEKFHDAGDVIIMQGAVLRGDLQRRPGGRLVLRWHTSGRCATANSPNSSNTSIRQPCATLWQAHLLR